jgi:hypothetical protein
LVDPQGSHWKTVADLPIGPRGGMCANRRIGTAHFSQGGGAVFGPGIRQTIARTAIRSAQYCSLPALYYPERLLLIRCGRERGVQHV